MKLFLLVAVVAVLVSSAAAKAGGEVYSWGLNGQGQLGHANCSKPEVVQSLLGRKVLSLAGGQWHTLAASKKGEVFAWGTNSQGQVGTGAASVGKVVQEPTKVAMPEGAGAVHKVAAGLWHSLALTRDGGLYTWGKRGGAVLGRKEAKATFAAPGRVALLAHEHMVDACAGDFHSVAVTNTSTVYSWGHNAMGLNVLGRTSGQEDLPFDVSSASGKGIVQVACGSAHTLAVTKFGRILSWGWNLYQQLGRDGEADAAAFVAGLSHVQVVKVAAGYEHSVALTADGKVFTWGRGEMGQLGRRVDNSFLPRRVELPEPAVDIAAGAAHTVVVTRSGKVYTWGDNALNQLARTGDDYTPVLVEDKELPAVRAVAASFQSTFALTPLLCDACAGPHQVCRGDGECVCESGWAGEQCEHRQCPGDCSGHGACRVNGTCACEEGFVGEDCSSPRCLNDCSGNGNCTAGKCECFAGFSDRDCSKRACPLNGGVPCGGFGDCHDGVCACVRGREGAACEVINCEFKNNCTGHGTCNAGQCVCNAGWTGLTCADVQCPDDCSGHGTCVNGTCACHAGFWDSNCAQRRCPNNCTASTNGVCMDGTCHCNDKFFGVDCSQLRCPNDCRDGNGDLRGQCQNGVCVCQQGFVGDDCATILEGATAPAPLVEAAVADEESGTGAGAGAGAEEGGAAIGIKPPVGGVLDNAANERGQTNGPVEKVEHKMLMPTAAFGFLICFFSVFVVGSGYILVKNRCGSMRPMHLPVTQQPQFTFKPRTPSPDAMATTKRLTNADSSSYDPRLLRDGDLYDPRVIRATSSRFL